MEFPDFETPTLASDKKNTKETENKTSSKEKNIYRKQCILLSVGRQLAAINRLNKNNSYKNFVQLQGSSSYTSNLLARKGISDLFSLKNHEISSLIPRIRFFKSFPLSNPQDLTDTFDVEFKFPSHFNDFLINFNGIEQKNASIFTSPTNIKEIGIKSVSMSFDGGNPAEKFLVNVNLQLSMRSLEDLLSESNYHQQDGKRYSLKYFDLISPYMTDTDQNLFIYDPDYYTIKMVVGWAKPNGNILKQELLDNLDGFSTTVTLNVVDHEINVENNGKTDVTINYRGALDVILFSDKTNILSSPEIQKLNHLIMDSKTQEYILEIEKEKIEGSLEKEFGEERWLETKKREEIAKSNKKIQEFLDETRSKPSNNSTLDMSGVAFKQAGGDVVRQGENNQTVTNKTRNLLYNMIRDDEIANDVTTNKLYQSREEIKVAIENQKKERKKILQELIISKNKRYQQLIRDLLLSGRAFYVDMPASKASLIQDVMEQNNVIFQKYENLVLSNTEEYQQVSQDIQDYKNNVSHLYDYSTSLFPFNQIKRLLDGEVVNNVIQTMLYYSHEQIMNDQTLDLSGDEKARISKQIANDLIEDIRSSLKYGSYKSIIKELGIGNYQDFLDSGDERQTRIAFVYFGDIVEHALQTLKNSDQPSLQNTKFLLGDIQLFSQDKKYSIGLADLPVSLDLFIEWYTNNVIKLQREKYLVRDFLTDIISELVPAAVKSKCFENNLYRFNQLEATNFTLPGVQNNDPIEQFTSSNLTGRLDMSNPDVLKFLKVLRLKSFKSNENDFNYILFNSNAIDQNSFNGDPIKDFEKGVYHFWIGNDMGLLKNISFSKNEMAHVREANLANSLEDGNLRILRNSYDATLTLVGNAIFLPGQFIFINPTMFGYGDPINRKSKAYELGLGGYYTIISVDSELTPSGYETVIQAKWEDYWKEVEYENITNNLATQNYIDALATDALEGINVVDVDQEKLNELDQQSKEIVEERTKTEYKFSIGDRDFIYHKKEDDTILDFKQTLNNYEREIIKNDVRKATDTFEINEIRNEIKEKYELLIQNVFLAWDYYEQFDKNLLSEELYNSNKQFASLPSPFEREIDREIIFYENYQKLKEEVKNLKELIDEE